jgi:hypothetical protein
MGWWETESGRFNNDKKNLEHVDGGALSCLGGWGVDGMDAQLR